MMNTSELRKKTKQELLTEKRDLLRESFNLRMQRAVEQVKHPDAFKKARRQIARINTILKEKAATNE